MRGRSDASGRPLSRGTFSGFGQVVVVVTAIACLLAMDMISDGPFHLAQDRLFGTYQQLWPPERSVSRTVLVEINEESIRLIGQWPWPRDALAAVIAGARGASAIGVDVLMPDADRLSPDRLIEQRRIVTPALQQALLTLPHPDEVLAAALRQLPTVLAMTVAAEGYGGAPESISVTPVRERGDGGRNALLRARGALWPLPILASAVHGIGIVSAPHSQSGEIITLPAAMEIEGSVLPAFGMELLKVALGADAIVLNARFGGLSSVAIGGLTIPTDASGGIRPRFVGAARLTTIPAHRLLDPAADRSMLQGRIVVIGVTVSGVGEMFRIPLGTWESSAAIQAELIESVIAGDTLWRPFWAGAAERSAGVVLGLAAGLLLGRVRYRAHAVMFGGVTLLMVGGSVLAFRGHGLLLDWLFPIACLFATNFAALAKRISVEVLMRRQREAELTVALMQRAAAERERALSAEADTLRQSLAIAVDAASLGVWDADLKQGTWHHSPRHDVILGLITPPARWCSGVLLDRVVPESHAATVNSMAAGEASGSLQVECRIRWPDGSLHDVHMVGRFWKDTEGVTTRVAGVVADITEQRVLEARLRQGERMQAVGLLAGGVAHNFNNLLTVVLGCLELASSKVDASSRVGTLLVRAIEAGRKGADIAHQLLAFARLQPLSPKPVDPAELLRDVYMLLQNGLSAIVQVRLEMAPDLGSIEIDPVEFKLALLNLAMNANDAMPDGGQLRLHASTRCICDTRLGLDGRFLVVEVTDDGVGVAPEILSNVFEPFFTTKEVGKGTGMGLSQVHGFAHQSGGAVDIDSIPGRGTRVRLFLPSAEHRVPPTEVSS